LVSGNYQGALKLYLYLAYLGLTGEAVVYQRLINAVMFLGVCASLCWALIPVVTRRWLLALLPLLAVSDPNYVIFMETDYGPFLLQNTFTALSFGFLLRAALNESPRALMLALLFASMVVADKLTGIPVAVALGITCLLVALRKWRVMLLQPRWLAGYTIVLVVPLIPTLIYILRAGGGLSAVTVSMTSVETLGFRNDAYMLQWIYRAPTSMGVAHYWIVFAVLAVAAALLAVRKGGRSAYALALLLIVFAVTALVFVLIPGLVSPWHYLIFNPLIYLGFALVVFVVVENVKARAVLAAVVVLVCANIAVAHSNVIRVLAFQNANEGKEFSSMAIYPLIEQLAQRGIKDVACLDYGPCSAIYILTVGRIMVHDYWFTEDLSQAKIDVPLSKPRAALILRDIEGMKDKYWEYRLRRGTWWFRSEGQAYLPPLKIDWLDPVGDTRYGIAVRN
jgi:hypothetical protein